MRAYDPMIDAGSSPAVPWSHDRATSRWRRSADADAVVLVTEWPEFARLDWAAAAAVMKRPLLIDGRNFVDPTVAAAAGWSTRASASARPSRGPPAPAARSWRAPEAGQRALPTQAVILVGGEGTRLRPITSRVPKPVAPVVERPFVAYILDNLARHGVTRAVFSTGFLAEAIEAEIGDGSAYGLEVAYAVEAEPLGTAGAIANCEPSSTTAASTCSTATCSATSTSRRSGDLHVREGRHGRPSS